MSKFFNANDLVARLRRGDDSAHRQFEELCSEAIARAIDQVTRRDDRPYYRDSLHQRTIAWAKMFIRSRNETMFHGMGRKVFLALVLTAVSRWLLEPSPPPRPKPPVAEAVPGSPHWEIDILLCPCGHVGGDWLGRDLLDDGTVWILVADACGKGYLASIIADMLALAWRCPAANDLRRRKCDPVALLALLGGELNRCRLPDGLFVEATAARLDPPGQASVGAAGHTRLLFRKNGACLIDPEKFGGSLLGLGNDIQAEYSQRSWQLDPGDELLLASDGFYDQPTHNGRLAENLAALDAHRDESSLLNAAHALLKRIWANHPQFDDTTLVGAGFKRIL
jgi:hypothetical protein